MEKQTQVLDSDQDLEQESNTEPAGLAPQYVDELSAQENESQDELEDEEDKDEEDEEDDEDMEDEDDEEDEEEEDQEIGEVETAPRTAS